MGLISKPLYYVLLFAIPLTAPLVAWTFSWIHFKPKSWQSQLKSDRYMYLTSPLDTKQADT
jgi:hypothetical protein